MTSPAANTPGTAGLADHLGVGVDHAPAPAPASASASQSVQGTSPAHVTTRSGPLWVAGDRREIPVGLMVMPRTCRPSETLPPARRRV